MKNLNERQVFLKNSLMYQMSLGSKELYHSNVWAWLIENDHSFIKVFFLDFNESVYEITGVARECCNRDIVVWVHKKGFPEKEQKSYLVVENKIKSLHTYEQLKRYTENLWDIELLGAVFTGIENNLEKDELEIKNNDVTATWCFSSYGKILTRIREIAKRSESEVIRNNLTQIEEYCEILDAIVELLDNAIKNTTGRLSYENSLGEQQIRLNDVFVKLKGSDFVSYFKQNWESEMEKICPKDLGFEPIIGSSFHNGKATLDFRFSNWQENCQDYLHIGIQIEGLQYRIHAEMHGKRHTVENVYDLLKNIWFDDLFDYRNNRFIFGQDTSMREKYCCYGKGSNAYSFVYQYYNIQESNNSYDNLCRLIMTDLNKAIGVIKSIIS